MLELRSRRRPGRWRYSPSGSFLNHWRILCGPRWIYKASSSHGWGPWSRTLEVMGLHDLTVLELGIKGTMRPLTLAPVVWFAHR